MNTSKINKSNILPISLIIISAIVIMFFFSIPWLIMAFICVGGITMYGGWGYYQQYNLIANTPTSKIRGVAVGMAEIKGEVVAPEEKILSSPITAKPCVYYRVVVKRWEKRGKSSEWVTILDNVKYLKFYLEDETGKILVDPVFAEMIVPISNQYTEKLKFLSFSSHVPELVNHLKSYDGYDGNPVNTEKLDLIKSKLSTSYVGSTPIEVTIGPHGKYKIEEYIIEPKQKLFVIGTAEDNPHVDEGWAQTSTEGLMMQKGKNRYIISTFSEKDVLKGMLANTVIIFITGGLFLVIGLYMLFSSL